MPFHSIPRKPAILIVQLGFQICDSKLFNYVKKTESRITYESYTSAAALAFLIQNNSIT